MPDRRIADIDLNASVRGLSFPQEAYLRLLTCISWHVTSYDSSI